MRFICLFLPALVATSEEVNEKDDILKKLAVFSKYCLYINFLMIIVLVIMGKAVLHFEDLVTVQFYGVYLLVGIVSAKVLPKALKFCKENFNIKIRRINK